MLFVYFSLILTAQTEFLDSLKKALKNVSNDTSRCYLLSQLAENAPEGEWQKYNDESKIFTEKKLSGITASHPLFKTFSRYLSYAYMNTGTDEVNQGHLEAGLENYKKSMKISVEIKDLKAIAHLYNCMATGYRLHGLMDSSLYYFNKVLKMHSESGDQIEYANSLHGIAGMYKDKGEVSKAMDLYKKSLSIFKKLDNKKGIATSLTYIGNEYLLLGDIPKALDHYGQALLIYEKIGDKAGTSVTLNNLGTINLNLNDYEKSLEYYFKSLKLAEEAADRVGTAATFGNIAHVFEKQNKSKEALEYYLKSKDLEESINNQIGMANAYNNLGTFYSNKNDLSSSIAYYEKCLNVLIILKDVDAMNNVFTNLGLNYLKQKNYSKATKYLNESMDLAKKLGYPAKIKNAAKGLSKLYKQTGDYRNALINFELFIQMRDSLNNVNTKKANIKSQLKYEYDKQAMADSVAHAKESEIKNAELARQTAEIKNKKNQQYALIGGLCLVLVFSFFLYNRFKLTQKQKAMIEDQKNIVEEQKRIVEMKQEEILDSIHYAKKIQTALMSNQKYIEQSISRLMGNRKN